LLRVLKPEAINLTAGPRSLGPVFLLYHLATLLSREKSKKIFLIIFPKTLDFCVRVWYYNNVKRESDERLREGLLKEIKVI
jgi:hypothetical protein